MVSKCRACGSTKLVPILNLGKLALTSIFQKDGRKVKRAPLELVLCRGACGLLQLRHSVSPDQLFGPEYGYESGINATMRVHLKEIVMAAVRRVALQPGDIVLDIGSNDGTLLDCYPPECTPIGVDPSGGKFIEKYRYKTLIIDYFSRASFGGQAKIITSISMLYDLEDPLAFMRDIAASLAPDGIWITEQAYMPAMLRNLAYDAICHEHIEYYGLRQIKWMADRVGLKIIDVSLNAINGGSFCVTLAHKDSKLKRNNKAITNMLHNEAQLQLLDYRVFRERVGLHRDLMRAWMREVKNKLVLGYGASTKGNVMLQYCGIKLKAIAERNPAKFRLRTPGTNIPIISEKEARAMKPDYFLVFPWHFRREIEAREKAFTNAGGKLFFPLGAN